jgi:hypothetical protein
MESDQLPAWAIIPAAFKLVGASVAHPLSAKTIIADPATRKVSVVSGGNGTRTSQESAPALHQP